MDKLLKKFAENYPGMIIEVKFNVSGEDLCRVIYKGRMYETMLSSRDKYSAVGQERVLEDIIRYFNLVEPYKYFNYAAVGGVRGNSRRYLPLLQLNEERKNMKRDYILDKPKETDSLFSVSFPTAVKIKEVIFNEPATIVKWSDGTKTVVKCQPGDTFDKYKGLALCIAKRAFGNEGNYNDIFKKWIEE